MDTTFHVDADSPWFRGHFPGNPVYPGIAQLGLVFDLLQKHTDTPLRLVDIRRVRFKQMVVPEDNLVVEASPKKDRDGAFAFRILKADTVMTSGMMTVAAASENNK
jgi:3-hydroxymyristoyl/3-hydroxydecanoyl-(acyl carrier protein) dehydratase